MPSMQFAFNNPQNNTVKFICILQNRTNKIFLYKNHINYINFLYTWAKKLFTFYLKLKFNWVSCICPPKPGHPVRWPQHHFISALDYSVAETPHFDTSADRCELPLERRTKSGPRANCTGLGLRNFSFYRVLLQIRCGSEVILSSFLSHFRETQTPLTLSSQRERAESKHSRCECF